MNITQIQYILAAAENGSISKAAEALFVSQPALSLQIKKLESELGFSLFYRTAQGVSLTPAGEEFYANAKLVQQSWEHLQQTCARLTRQNREHLCIHLGPRVFSNGLFPKIVMFFEQHPYIEPTFIVAGDRDFLEDLKNGDIDLALNYLSSAVLFPDAQRFFRCELIREPQCILTHRGSRLAKQEQVSFADLRDYTIIAAPEESMEARILKNILQKHGVVPGRMYRLDSIDTAMEMVRSGTGIVLGPKSFAEYYGVCAVPLSPPFEESLSFVCLRENKNRIGLKELRKYLLEIC